MNASLYLRADALVRRLPEALHPVWSGLCLGALGRAGLHAIDQRMYERRRSYHEAEHNRRGLFPWEAEAVAAYFPPGARVAVLAAGGGREVLALWRMGFAPEGFECNPALVVAAERLLPAEGCPRRVWPVARDAAPAEGDFDAAVVGWSGYSLVAGREVRVAMLRGVRRLLPAGAPVLVSFFTRADDDRRAGRVAGVAGGVRRLLRRPPPEPGDDLLPNFVHRFTRAEVEGELADGGFRTVRWEPQGSGPYDSGWAVGRAVTGAV